MTQELPGQQPQGTSDPIAATPEATNRPGTASTADTPASSSAKLFSQLRAIAETLILTIVIFFVVQTFIAQPYVVDQVSMQQTLNPSESVLVDKLTPRFDDYSRGDIIVFPDPHRGKVPFIKRVIGVPGDVVELREGVVYVNDVALHEPYLYDEFDDPVLTEPLDEDDEGNPLDHWTIEPGTLFVMGDHRNQSVDSRSFGPIDRDAVIGRAVLRYWPLDTFSILQTPTYPGVPAGG